jgi:hypothetical protein
MGNLMENSASFLFPVIDDLMYVGQRVKEPNAGMYGALGGKPESLPGKRTPWDKPHTLGTMGGGRKLSIVDSHALDAGLETRRGTAVRECCEEIFPRIDFPEEFAYGDITHVGYIGAVTDLVGGVPWQNYFFVAMFNRNDFNPKQDEVSDFRPLKDVDPDNVWNLSKIALEGLRWWVEGDLPLGSGHYTFRHYVDIELSKQIPEFPTIEARSTGMAGATKIFFERGIWPRHL